MYLSTNKSALSQTFVDIACSVIASGMYYSTFPAVSYDNNPYRSKNARAFKRKKKRHKAADKSRRANRGR